MSHPAGSLPRVTSHPVHSHPSTLSYLGRGRRAALVVGASFSHHAQGGRIWPDGAGMPDPQPQAAPPNQLGS